MADETDHRPGAGGEAADRSPQSSAIPGRLFGGILPRVLPPRRGG